MPVILTVNFSFWLANLENAYGLEIWASTELVFCLGYFANNPGRRDTQCQDTTPLLHNKIKDQPLHLLRPSIYAFLTVCTTSSAYQYMCVTGSVISLWYPCIKCISSTWTVCLLTKTKYQPYTRSDLPPICISSILQVCKQLLSFVWVHTLSVALKHKLISLSTLRMILKVDDLDRSHSQIIYFILSILDWSIEQK